MDFVAVRLRPGAEVAQMQPLRVVMPGYVPVLPLRMIGAGVADKVGLVLTILSESRLEAMNFPNGELRDADIVFDFDRAGTDPAADFLAAFDRANRAAQGRLWLTESAAQVALVDVENARAIRCSSAFPAAPPECDRQSVGAPDIALAFRPFGASARVTRLRADLGGAQLDRDLQLAASDRGVRLRTYNYGTLRNDPCINPRSQFEGCSAGGRGVTAGHDLAALALVGLIAAARTRRRRAQN
jgi:hypothetical protein